MSFEIFPTENFADLRQNGGYYVDKTRFFEQFLKAWPEAALFTRPRRFGKSLFMSMLAEFFDIKKQGDKQNLFEGLAVSANEKLCQEWMHQYPVISISLKSVDSTTFSEAMERIGQIVSRICKENSELLNSNDIDSEDHKVLKQLRGKEANTATLKNSLFFLTDLLHSHYGKKVILLIDEYDVPIANAAENNYYNKMSNFMRGFLSDAMKSNHHLKFAILTGALRISKESYFTGLNNLECFDISSTSYADIIGFTQDEVDKLLIDTGFEEKRDIIKEWYDGYHFGNRTDMYCPWSIMKYVRELKTDPDEEPQAWWVNTSKKTLVQDFAKRLRDTAKLHGNFAALLAGDPISVKLNPYMNYTDIFTSADNFWTLLYLTGYLTLASVPSMPSMPMELQDKKKNRRTSLLVIPNEEIREVFQDELEVLLKKILPENQRRALCNALWDQNAQELEKQLGLVLQGCSFHDANEAYYHGMMYGLLRPIYGDTESNRQTGKGRCDIIVPDKENLRAAVLEFKRATADTEDKLEAGVRVALKQIADRKYGDDLKGYTSIVRAGIAFFGKSVKVGFEEVQGKADSPAP